LLYPFSKTSGQGIWRLNACWWLQSDAGNHKMVSQVGVLTTRLLLSNSHPLSAPSGSVRLLIGPKTDPLTGPISAHQNPSLSGSTWLVRVICNFPLAKWLGNSAKVAAQHYLMSRDHYFEDVVCGGESSSLAGAVGVQRSQSECDAKCDSAGVRTRQHRAAQNDRTRGSHSGYRGFFGNNARCQDRPAAGCRAKN
jgi:hypothetical protein